MAANTSPIFEKAPKVIAAQFTISDTTTPKSLGTIGSEGMRIDSIMCSTNDTTAVNLSFYLNNGATDFYIGVVNVPIGSGYTTVARVEALNTLAPALGYLVVPAGWTIKAGCVATMTTAKVTDVVAMGGDY